MTADNYDNEEKRERIMSIMKRMMIVSLLNVIKMES